MATIEARRADDGNISYRAKVRLKGHPAEYATFKRKTDATKWAQSIEAAMREGRHFPAESDVLEAETWFADLGGRHARLDREVPQRAAHYPYPPPKAPLQRHGRSLLGSALSCLHSGHEGLALGDRQPGQQDLQASPSKGA